jgi:hypothetical protein
LKGRLKLSDAERVTLGEIGHRLGRPGTLRSRPPRRLDSEHFRSAPRTCGRFRYILSLR